MNLAALTAMLFTTSGVGTLFMATRRAAWKVPASGFGWLLLITAGWIWAGAYGAEYGIVLTLLVPAVNAWVVIAANRRVHHRRPGRRSVKPGPSAPFDTGGHLGRFMVTVPLAGSTAILVAVALALPLPTSKVNTMAVVVMAMPVLWGTFSWWALADLHRFRPAISMAMAALVSGFIICLWPQISGMGR